MHPKWQSNTSILQFRLILDCLEVCTNKITWSIVVASSVQVAPERILLVGANPQSPKIIPALRDGCAFCENAWTPKSKKGAGVSIWTAAPAPDFLQTLFLLAHVAGVGTVHDLSGRFIDEINGDVLYLGAVENIVHSAVHIERQHGEGLRQIQFRGSRGNFEFGKVRVIYATVTGVSVLGSFL